MSLTFDVVVVGAGYIGCSAAYYLTKAGLKTALIDRVGVASGASSANYGNIQVQDVELEHSIPMITAGYRCFDHLEEELGRPIGLKRIGGLLLIENESQWRSMQARAALLNAAGIEAELIPSSSAPEVEPLLDPASVLGVCYHPEEGQVDPFALIWAFLSKALEQGLSLFTHISATHFEVAGGRVSGVHTSAGLFQAGSVVLTSGAWTEQLGRTLGLRWEIPFISGQAMVTEPVRRLLRCHIASAAFFEDVHEAENGTLQAALAISQSPHGHLLLGEAYHPDTSYSRHLSRGSLEASAAVLVRYFSAFRDLRVLRGWGRPVAFTHDGLPYFGPVAAFPGLILATAFRSTVIVTPLAGQIITQLIQNGCSDLDLAHFSPDRALHLSQV
jgi:glycine/D-amino acid oxidase-like deaminating enzyme